MGRIDMFSELEEFMEENALSVNSIKASIMAHLQSLLDHFHKYFPEGDAPDHYDWIRSPFNVTTANHLTSDMEDALIELSTDRTLRTAFDGKTLDEFWVSVAREYPQLSKAALDVLMQFGSTYLSMASAGLLFLMLMSSFFLVSISTKIISSDDQKQQQEKSSKTSDKVKYVGKVALKSVVTIMAAVGPFMSGIESQAKVDEEAKIAYKTASAMFQVHKKCIDNSMEYIKNDVETLIDNTKKSSDLAKEVCSFLVKEYDRYDWMVVAFKTKKSNKPFESLNSHVLTGFTDKTKGGISVAFARQVKGNHTKTALVKQTIGSCIKDSDKCHEVANKLRGCFEAKGGTSVSLPYTAVHAYLRKAHDSYNTPEETDEDYEVSAAPEDQAPAVYIGKCKKYLGPMSGKFVVLIKSDEEMEEKDPCSKLNCGGEERGKCVKVEGMFLAMCECKMPYYGEHCEESLEDYKKYLKGEKEMVESTQHDQITKF
ncbi:unnamed protein product [Leuciscus chuanchicus]